MKVCFVVSHPDDELLWALPIIEHYKRGNEVFILSLTHMNDDRGKEFQSVCRMLGVNPLLYNLNDLGWKHPLQKIRFALNHYFNLYKFDLLITHPPHGNERPHSHHVEAFIECERFSSFQKISFGFFSEISYRSIGDLTWITANPFFYCIKFYIKSNPLFVLRLYYLWMVRRTRFFFRKIQFEQKYYEGDLKKLHELLMIGYPSQIEGLKKYVAYNQPSRFLVLYNLW